MKRKYFRLYLDNSWFWQTNDKDKTVEEKYYELNSEDVLNKIYFRQFTENIYIEEYTNEKVIFSPKTKNIVLPKGIKIDIDNFQECSIEEVINSYDEIKKKNLNKEYYKLLCDFIYRSNLCAHAEEKKNNSLKLKK